MRFTRARYQQGRLIREERKVGPDVWIFRWREQTPEGRCWSNVCQPMCLTIPARTAAGRHSFATLLKANGEDVKVVQESLRHANSRITLDVYTQGLMPTKRQTQGRVVKSLLAPNGPTPATSVAASA